MESGFRMLLYKNKIVVTGGTGRFGQELKKIKSRYEFFFPKKNELDILNYDLIIKYIKKKKTKIFSTPSRVVSSNEFT